MRMPQRAAAKRKKTRTKIVIIRSMLPKRSTRRLTKQAMPQGSISQTVKAINVPTELACIELLTSPRLSNEKLVVIPQDGHGFPVATSNEQGGSPICVWVD